jgi:hypothetical protein
MEGSFSMMAALKKGAAKEIWGICSGWISSNHYI